MTHVNGIRATEPRPFPRLYDNRLSSRRHCLVGIVLAALALIVAELIS